jgi:hypothetical protein
MPFVSAGTLNAFYNLYLRNEIAFSQSFQKLWEVTKLSGVLAQQADYAGSTNGSRWWEQMGREEDEKSLRRLEVVADEEENEEIGSWI